MYLNSPACINTQSVSTFNFNKSCIWIKNENLDLARLIKFNFNKSCIWILNQDDFGKKLGNLTLTRVVFELV